MAHKFIERYRGTAIFMDENSRFWANGLEFATIQEARTDIDSWHDGFSPDR